MKQTTVLHEQEAHLYERIAAELAERIHRAIVKPGERLPSVRRLSQQQGVSISTVLQAYIKLEDMGLVESRPQSGYYVRHRQRALREPAMHRAPLRPSSVSVVSAVRALLDASQNPAIVPLGAATPDPALLPSAKLYRTLASVVRTASPELNSYGSTAGANELRRLVAFRSLDWGGSLSTDDIIVTTGCTESLSLCLRAVTRPGDTLAVESPSYFGVLQIIEGLGLKALHIPTDPRDGMCISHFEEACRRYPIRACLLMPNFHNPLGALMPDGKKRELVAIASRYNVPIVEDDTYGDLHFERQRPRNLKSFDTEGNVLLCSSFSKTLSPDFRIGWTAPGRYYEQVLRLKMTSTLASPSILQHTIAHFLRDGGYDHHVRGMRKTLSIQIERAAETIARYFPPGTGVTRPLGGFVLWVELPTGVDALLLQQQALEENISIAPGPVFSAENDFSNCIRINCGCVWSDTVEQALIRLGELASAQL